MFFTRGAQRPIHPNVPSLFAWKHVPAGAVGSRLLPGPLSLPLPAAALMADVYADHKDEDNFLYITYSGENTFG